MKPIGQSTGETIIEVLLAISIAALAIGVTYATAQSGLNQTITAREHNAALNLAENQLTQLRIGFQRDPTGFAGTYGSPNTHFCLTSNRAIYHNNGNAGPPSQTAPLALKPNGPYDSNCTNRKTGDGVTYFYDIETSLLKPPVVVNPTVFQIIVRWEPLTGAQTNQVSLFYRVNGAASQSLGYALGDSLAKLYAYRGAADES